MRPRSTVLYDVREAESMTVVAAPDMWEIKQAMVWCTQIMITKATEDKRGCYFFFWVVTLNWKKTMSPSSIT